MEDIFVMEKVITKKEALRTLLAVRKATIVETFCFLLILLYVYTAVSKFLDYKNFTIQLGKSPFISGFSKTIAWSIPIGELLIALALLLKPIRLLGLYASLFIMTMFSAYIYAMLTFSYDIPCSCGGVLEKMSWQQHLWFNVFFVLISLAGILLKVKAKRVKSV